MRPAGYSSDEEDFEEDGYFYLSIPEKKTDQEEEDLSKSRQNIDGGLKGLLDTASKVSVFHRAAEASDLELMRELIEKGVSVDDANINEWTPLMKACSGGKTEVVRFLLENGADPNLHKELFTPLMACCIMSYVSEEDRLACLRLLLQFGANVNATDKNKETALILAASNGLEAIVGELVTVPEIALNATDKQGWTALFHAVNYNHKGIVQKLIEAGIDVHIYNINQEYTALQLAEMKNYKGIIKILQPLVEETTEPTERAPPVDPLEAFLMELPNSRGEGGYMSEVRYIFSGVGLEKLYDRLKIEVSLPDFLVMRDLSQLGIIMEPMRQRLKVRGIHRYHLKAFSANSLRPVPKDKPLSLDDCIEMVSGVTKHLAILYSTLRYVQIRISERSSIDKSINKEIVKMLVDSHVEVHMLRKMLNNVLSKINKIKTVGETEVDYIGRDADSEPKKRAKYLWIALGAITATTAAFYYRSNHSR